MRLLRILTAHNFDMGNVGYNRHGLQENVLFRTDDVFSACIFFVFSLTTVFHDFTFAMLSGL